MSDAKTGKGEDRAERGARTFEEVLGVPMRGGVLDTPLTEAARDFVFAEVWARPGLDRRSRRWITLSAVCAAGAELPMRTYLKAALDSGEITEAELYEFCLQFAVFQGFPKAVRIEMLIRELAAERAGK
jgi:4-carboxymuconolactone decarboxylase